jgi:hypothetical protein
MCHNRLGNVRDHDCVLNTSRLPTRYNLKYHWCRRSVTHLHFTLQIKIETYKYSMGYRVGPRRNLVSEFISALTKTRRWETNGGKCGALVA